MKVKFLENNKISVNGKEPKSLLPGSNITSNRTVVGFQITIWYGADDYDILTFKKSEVKEYIKTLLTLKNYTEMLKAA